MPPATASAPTPAILQIHRETVKPGREESYGAIERETAQFCAQLGCPHPYLALESLTGEKEVWYFNGYASADEPQQVVDAYKKNPRLMVALAHNSERKARLTQQQTNCFATYRPNSRVGTPWTLSVGRFLVITVMTGDRAVDGTVFVTDDETRFILRPADTREAADAAASTDPEARVFAVRPAWSFPAEEWIARDPEFWRAMFGTNR